MAAAVVKSVATRRFWDLFHRLPPEIRKLAAKNYQLWRRDPRHPALRFKRLQGSNDRFSIRIGDHYRALGMQSGDTIIWVWIGTHAEYDRILGT